MIKFLMLFLPMFKSYCVYVDEDMFEPNENGCVVPFMVSNRSLENHETVPYNMTYVGSFRTFEWLWMKFDLNGGLNRVAQEYGALKGLV